MIDITDPTTVLEVSRYREVFTWAGMVGVDSSDPSGVMPVTEARALAYGLLLACDQVESAG
jgi:hypothetical protein